MTMRYAHLAPPYTLAAVERLVAQSDFSVPTSVATVEEVPTATKTVATVKVAEGVRSATSN